MKYYKSLLLLLLLSSCGSTGHIVFFEFSSPKYEVQKELTNIINKDSLYSVPNKWVDGTKGDYLEYYYVYFRKNPEEMYQISFSGDSTNWNYSTSCRLAIVARYLESDGWKYAKDLDSKGIERVTCRFETEILSKLKYNYIKSE